MAKRTVGHHWAIQYERKTIQTYQKQYLWWLKSAKRIETRKKRVLAIVERCEQGVKPGM
jgi:uncharacterized protein YdeI (YjbR/CyaY-like superfamily)